MSDATPPVPKEQPRDYELRVERRGLLKLTHWLRSTLAGRLSVAALLVAILFAWQGPAIYRGAKVWRVKKLIAHSEEAWQARDEPAETRLLQEAFKLLPTHGLTWRARAHFLERRGDSAALVPYAKLLGHKEATKDDAIRACRLGASRGSPETNAKVLNLAEQIEGASEHPAVFALRARTKADAHLWSEAYALAQTAAEHPDGGPPEKLTLATILLRSVDTAASAERFPLAERAVALLSELTTASDETAVDALSALIHLTHLPAAATLFSGHDVSRWIEAGDRHPNASARVRVHTWNFHLATKRGEADQVFAAFFEKWRESPLPQRLEAARWLNQNGRPRLCLGLTFPERDASEDWFLVHLDALAALGQWVALLEHLDSDNGQAAAMSGALRSLFRLIARAKLGEPINVEESWREIQLQLQSDPVPAQLFIAQYAEKTGEFKQAAITYQRILELSTTSSLSHNLSREAKFACYTGLLRSLPVSAPFAELLPIVESFSAEFPAIAEARNDVIYMRVLAGKLGDQDRADISRLLAQSPAEPKFLATAALIELQSGNAAAAHKLYEDIEIDWNSALDRVKAVRIAVLAGAGRPEEARKMRAKIRESKLRPEELALLP